MATVTLSIDEYNELNENIKDLENEVNLLKSSRIPLNKAFENRPVSEIIEHLFRFERDENVKLKMIRLRSDISSDRSFLQPMSYYLQFELIPERENSQKLEKLGSAELNW